MNQEESQQKHTGSIGSDPEPVKTMGHKGNRYEGPVAPVVASIVAVLAWAIFILLYALFWSSGYSLFQNFIVTVVTLLITGLIIGLMWVLLGPRNYWRGGIH